MSFGLAYAALQGGIPWSWLDALVPVEETSTTIRNLCEEPAPVQVAIACRHGSIKPDLNDYIRSKSEKLLTYFERVTAIQVTLDFDHETVKVEILVDAEHKHNFVASAEGGEAGAAFDQSLHKMEQQIRKYKEKVQDHRRDQSLNDALEAQTADESLE